MSTTRYGAGSHLIIEWTRAGFVVATQGNRFRHGDPSQIRAVVVTLKDRVRQSTASRLRAGGPRRGSAFSYRRRPL